MKNKHYFGLCLIIIALLELILVLKQYTPIKAMIISIIFMFPAYHIFCLLRGVNNEAKAKGD